MSYEKTDFIIYYELCYSIDKERIKRFVSMDHAEVRRKTSEVMAADSNTVHIQFHKFSATYGEFLSALRKAAECI